MDRICLQIILLANDNGSQAATVLSTDIVAAVVIAKLYPGKLVICCRSGDRLIFNKVKQVWEYVPADFTYSASDLSFMAMMGNISPDDTLAHETGHYFHPELFYSCYRVVAQIKEFEPGYQTQAGD